MRTPFKMGLAAMALVALTACQTTTQPMQAKPAQKPAAPKMALSASKVFVEACVKTASNPNAAAEVLKSMGFRPSGTKRGDAVFTHSVGKATLSSDSRTGGYGQCSVTPKSGSFEESYAGLRALMPQSGVQAMPLGGEAAWMLPQTRAVVLVSRSKGAMTRTQPGVFRN